MDSDNEPNLNTVKVSPATVSGTKNCNKCFKQTSAFASNAVFDTWWCPGCNDISHFFCHGCGNIIEPTYTASQSQYLYLKRHMKLCQPEFMATSSLHQCKCRNILIIDMRPADPIIKCGSCNAKHYKCTQCDQGYRTCPKKLRMHQKTHDLTVNSNSTPDDFSSGPNEYFDNSYSDELINESDEKNHGINDEICLTEIAQSQFELSDFKKCFTNMRSQVFFWQDNTVAEGGRRGVAWRAYNYSRDTNAMRDNFNPYDLLGYATLEETNFIFSLTRLVNKLTINLQNEVITCFDHLLRALMNSYPEASFKLAHVHVPRFHLEVNQLLLTNRNSVMQNILTCKTIKIGKHTCISINDKINQLMAFGVPLEWYNPYEVQDGLNGTKAMDNLYQQLSASPSMTDSTKYGYIVLWSDAFQVHYVRTINNSVWILTMTLSPPSGKMLSCYHTFIVAIGLKNWCHDEVIDYFMDELKTISDGQIRYCGIEKKMVHTSFGLLQYVADMPERFSIAGLIKGGNQGMAFPYSTWLHRDRLISCHECIAVRTQSLSDFFFKKIIPEIAVHICNNCRDWNIEGTTKPFRTEVHRDYPRTNCAKVKLPKRRNVTVKHFLPMKQNFPKLVQCSKVAMINLYKKKWSVTNFAVFLECVGINKHCHKRMKEEVKQAHLSDQKKLTFSSIPKLWTGSHDVDVFVNSHMHLLYLGIVKTLLSEVREYIAIADKQTAYVDAIEPLMRSIKNMHLSSCRLEMYYGMTNKKLTAGWLCDNFVAFARLMPVLFAPIFTGIIGYNDKGFNKETHDCLEHLIVSCFVMISYLMVSDGRDKVILDHLIRVFLQSCYRYDSSRKDSTMKHFWENKPNFLTLINITESIQLYGPIRYSNDMNKEREIQSIKPIIDNMRKTENFFQVKLQDLEASQVLDLLHEKYMSQNTADQKSEWYETILKERGSDYKIYADIQHVTSMITRGIPFMGYYVEMSDGQIIVYVACGNKDSCLLIELEFISKGQGEYHLTLWYQEIEISDKAGTPASLDVLKSSHDVKQCMLIPMINRRISLYTVITNTWRIRAESNVIALPHLPKKIYSTK